MRLILLGPPGAGKGTQCKRIVESYRIAHLSSGDILRAERSAASKLGKEAQVYMDTGALVPDSIIIEMMINAIKKFPKGYVLDGFPRTTVQAQQLDKALAEAGEKIDAIVDLQVQDKVIAARLTGRRSCPLCGAVYHLENLKPRAQGVCDRDGRGLVQREDDKPEVVANRLRTYHQQTAAVVGYYKKQGSSIVEIDADRPADQVSAAIFDELDRLKSVKVG